MTAVTFNFDVTSAGLEHVSVLNPFQLVTLSLLNLASQSSSVPG